MFCKYKLDLCCQYHAIIHIMHSIVYILPTHKYWGPMSPNALEKNKHNVKVLNFNKHIYKPKNINWSDNLEHFMKARCAK